MTNPVFRVVERQADDPIATVISLGDAAARSTERRVLIAEALALEASVGGNPYSDYVIKNARLPEPAEACSIGQLLGGRVRASDGSLQPPLSKDDREAIKASKARKRAASNRYDQISNLRSAIDALARMEDDPATLIAGGSVLLDRDQISLQIDTALCWLNRFAEEWHSCGKETRP